MVVFAFDPVVVPLLVMLPLKFSVVPLKVIPEAIAALAALLWMVRFPVPLIPPVDEMVLPLALLEITLRLLPRVIAPEKTGLKPGTRMEFVPVPVVEIRLV